jgi:microcin C transport system substrate-binding protein
MRLDTHMKIGYLGHAAALSILALLAGCGGGDGQADNKGLSARDNTAEVQEYYKTKVSIPPAVREAFERGEITQEELDKRSAAGEFPKFFHYATPQDIPADLVWEDGSDLPEFASPEAKKGGTLHFWIDDFPRTLRTTGPDANGSFRTYILDDNAMLFARRHPNDTSIGSTGFHYYPGVAEAWAVDRANKQVYVKIDPKARWSDGVPITVDDVFFMFFFYQSKYIRQPWYNNWYTRSYTGVTRYDDLTFSIGMPEMKPDVAAHVLEVDPIPAHFFKELGDDFPERYQWRFQPTTGAYVVRDEDIKKGESIALTRNKDWWAKDKKFWRNRYNFDRIYLSVIRDTPKAFEAFKKGDLDMFGLTLPDYWYDKLPNDDPLVQKGYIAKAVFYNQIPRPTYGLWMNESRPLLDNRDIRVGIQYATNWDMVIQQYFRGDYTRMRTTSDGYGEFTEPTIQPRGYSIDKALDSFAKAGFTKRGPDGILVNDAGQRLSFTVTTGYDNLRDVLTILREQAAKAGLEFRIEVLDGTAAWKKVQEKQHDIQFSAFAVSQEMYPRYWETYHSVNAYDKAFLPDGSPNPDRKPKTGTNNLQAIAIPELDKMIEAYRASGDAAEMKRLAFAMEKILYDDASFSPGFVMPFFRTGYWRYIRWPEGFNVKLASTANEYWLAWIDPDLKKEVEEARKSGKTFPPMITVYDQYRDR